jgi:glutaredoxin
MKKIAFLSLVITALFFSFTRADIRQWFAKKFTESTAIVLKQLKTADTTDRQSDEIIYQWVDERGGRHFSNSKPPGVEGVKAVPATNYTVPSITLQERQERQERKAAPAVTNQAPRRITKQPKRKKTSRQAATKDKVVIFTASSCPYCKQALSFLRAHRIAFTEYNIERDSTAKKKMRATGGVQHVPFAVINGKKLFGFSEGSYRRALNLPESSGGSTSSAQSFRKRFRSTGRT